MKPILNYVSFSAIVLVCCAAGYGVYLKSLAISEQTPSKPKPPPMVVEVTRLQEKPIVDRVELVGSLEAVTQG
ncbi:MAG TPA: hypothetical protein VLA12_11030, partial [Planctomycetaceae bacterium]|nr:hypothetical protein [Planctomycetaceae bacterium]